MSANERKQITANLGIVLQFYLEAEATAGVNVMVVMIAVLKRCFIEKALKELDEINETTRGDATILEQKFRKLYRGGIHVDFGKQELQKIMAKSGVRALPGTTSARRLGGGLTAEQVLLFFSDS